MATVSLVSFMACSHGPTLQEFADTASPGEEVAKLDTDMNAALANQVNVLSPVNFKKAQESLADATESLDHQKDAKVTLHEVAVGRAYLGRSKEFAELSHTNMEGVVTARQQALNAGAPQSFDREFRSADDRLREATSDLEKNELQNTEKNRDGMQAAYLELELKAIKQGSLGQSRDVIAQAIDDGAKKFAPRSLALAEKSVQDTDAYITANRHETLRIKERSDGTLANANHALKITHDSKLGKKTSSEDTALRLEDEQSQVEHKELELSEKQSQLDNTQDQLQSKQAQLSVEQDTTHGLAQENRKLESDQAFDRSFDQARAEFTTGEAEVYKQGDTLMIRLRGLEFMSAHAVLKGSNFPLLAKVQKVIREFGKSSVIVEGHTDSRGGKQVNEKLSSDRAEAVKSYLQANAGAEPIAITAVGYDYQKPLASNKTAAGRAQNRRVDILIKPEKTAQL